ncbi:MAG TPA: hypothetical protein VNE59_03790 [Burkholderiales bacterium]|nr:hypothetical protein [Burkholderiales bacterium]
MPIRHSIDTAARVSRELSALLEALVNDPDREPPQSLGEARATVLEHSTPATRQTEFLHPQDGDSLLVELDALIEEYGGDAPPSDFIANKASEALSRVIEAAMGDAGLPDEPTLGIVRAAMLGGLTARMTGGGTLDEEDEGPLIEEIDDLIERYGEDADAETFIRFE